MIYEYKCDVHGVFEVQQSINDQPLDRCPQCAKENIMEYYCPSCDASWVSDDKSFSKAIREPTNCTRCATSSWSSGLEKRFLKPRKLISLSSFILKGGGWASEGYK